MRSCQLQYIEYDIVLLFLFRISNGGIADIFTVFAKVCAERNLDFILKEQHLLVLFTLNSLVQMLQ